MTFDEAGELLALLKALYPRQTVDLKTATAYAKFLEDLDYAAVERAICRIVATKDFFPTVAEIRREVAVAATAHLAEPELAWRDVERAISKVGAPGYPAFEGNAAMNAAIDAVGWRNICLDENVASSRARFVDAYRSARDSAVRELQIGRIAPPACTLERVEIRNLGPGIARMTDRDDAVARPLEGAGLELVGKFLTGRFPSKRGA